MIWGNFTFLHIITLIFALLINFILYLVIKKLSKQNQIFILTCLSFLGIGAIIYNLLAWNSPLEYLPLHLCSLNALILPICIISQNNRLANLLIHWSLGALVALIINNSVSNTNILGFTFFFYYFPHVFECGIPIIMLKLGLYKLEKKYIFSTLLITFTSYTLIHFINVFINNYCTMNNILNNNYEVVKVNYMFSIYPDNPFLQLLYNLLPYSYFYMLLCFPIIALYLIIIYSFANKKNNNML